MGKTILIVDDSVTVRQQVGMALGQAGFDVMEAGDGNEGISAVASNPNIAMVVADINMPNMNGLDMVVEIKKSPNNASLPILMLTTEGHPSLIKKAKEAGAIGWIVKPFNATQLIATAKKLTA
ncbi:MAG: response regulator [Nitrospiria bacterium]